MNTCANHPALAARTFCRTCGKPLCDKCERDVQGVVYCEQCIAARLQGAVPAAAVAGARVARAPGTPNPTLAAFLGIIPGVGAFYNGQYVKGVVHVLLFPALAAMTDRVGAFGILIPIYFAYMIVDAYKTAQAREIGAPLPDYLGITSMFGGGTPVAPVAAVDEQGNAINVVPQSHKPPPVGPIILIGLGTLFLLNTMGIIEGYHFERGWPIILIIVGAWKIYNRVHVKATATD